MKQGEMNEKMEYYLKTVCESFSLITEKKKEHIFSVLVKYSNKNYFYKEDVEKKDDSLQFSFLNTSLITVETDLEEEVSDNVLISDFDTSH